jgi:ceramide glucosyltransferase
MFLTVVRWLIWAGALASFGYYLLAIYSAWRFYRRQREPLDNFTPLVSILKPVRGLDPQAYENFASFCRQNYPEYEILFGVSDKDDPVLSVIERIQRDFPERHIRLLIGSDTAGASSKVTKLCRLVREARHDLLVISDSDMRVEPDYLRTVVAPFHDPQVGAVTCPYMVLEPRGLGSQLEGIGESSDFYAGVLTAWFLEGVRFTMGSTMATTRQRLAEIGGFEQLVDHFIEDFELGNRIAARGYRVELLPYPVGMILPVQGVREYFAHQLRWMIATRHVRPLGYIGMVLTHGLPWAVAAAGLAPSPEVAAGYLGSYAVLRLAMAWMVGVRGLKDPVLQRKLWLLPLRDALAFSIWTVGLFSNRIEWRGREFIIQKGHLIPIAARDGRG